MPRSIDPSNIKKGSGLANQNSIDANAFVDELVEGLQAPLKAHIEDGLGAHAASAISTTGSQEQYFTMNAQGNFDELAALVPIKPSSIGTVGSLLSTFGIPDWGALKLYDAGLIERGDVASPDPTTPNTDAFVYPEFWYPAFETADILGTNLPGGVFDPWANDPITDPTFNVDPVGTGDPTYTGGGPGTTHHGAFTRGARPVIETARIIRAGPGNPVVVSGKLFPADRGVLALFHWPAGGDISAFLAQPLDVRVLAALNLGQGVNDDCDGDPGGIFTEGGVFGFPGRASGQLDLAELHAGVNAQTGDPLPAGPQPTAGQVRLGIDPNAGPVIPGGIKILGGTTLANGGGNDNNFFRYRLPHLNGYAEEGLAYTPPVEKPRYFEKPLVALDYLSPLTQAGDYEDFEKDYWTFQIARYRHRFNLLSPPGDQGSYFLLHFRREADFEAFARDGVMPDDLTDGYDLWSSGLVNYLNPESVDNLVDATDPADPQTSTAYHSLRAAVFEDPDPAPIALLDSYDYIGALDEVMFCSGVQYFLPNAAAGAGEGWKITELTLQLANLWSDAYLLGNHGTPAEQSPGLQHRPPVILYLGIGTSQQAVINGSGPGYTGVDNYQRVDFDYQDLDVLGGPWSLIQGPLAGQTADIVLTAVDTPIRFRGDDEPCHFWHNGNVRAFARRPLGNQDPLTLNTEFLFPLPGGDQILFHTTSQSPGFPSSGSYGNFPEPPNNYPRAPLENERKDVEERFLDEVYRFIVAEIPNLDPTYDPILMIGNLTGPGLPFAAAPIELPVRVGSSPAGTFGFASYLQNDYHLLDLSLAPVSEEAQVAGLPDRSPPVTDGAANPVPFAGRLIFPSEDYTVGFRPSVIAGDTSNAQFDYSGITNTRNYVRVLDAAYKNDTDPEPTVVGQSFLYFRVDGLHLEDFAYAPPGPGNSDIAILIKIPGLTTWMDLGRLDGDGPSKQDPLKDGAGCQVKGPETFNGFDAQTGVAYCQVKAHVGPVATVFANTVVAPPDRDVAPVVLRCLVPRTSTLDFRQGGPNGTSADARALVGVTVLRFSNQQGPDPFPLPTFP